MTAQTFSAVTSLSFNSADAAFDGVLGLGFPSPEDIGTPFVQNAFNAGKVARNSFGMRIDLPEAQLHLGGGDQHQYEGEIEEHAVDSSEGEWRLKGTLAFVGGTLAVSGLDAIIDSGTDWMFGPREAVRLAFI